MAVPDELLLLDRGKGGAGVKPEERAAIALRRLLLSHSKEQASSSSSSAAAAAAAAAAVLLRVLPPPPGRRLPHPPHAGTASWDQLIIIQPIALPFVLTLPL